MGFLQNLFKRKPKTETATTEPLKVEVTDGKADVVTTPTRKGKTTTKTPKATTKTTAAKTPTTATTTKACAATTKAGTPCKRVAVGRSKFCATHKN